MFSGGGVQIRPLDVGDKVFEAHCFTLSSEGHPQI